MKRSLLVCLALLVLFLGFLAGYAVGISVPRGIVPVAPSPSPAPTVTLPALSPAATVPLSPIAPTSTPTPHASDAPVSPTFPININTADASTLCALPGIGEVLAERIIAFREQNGPYASPEELMNVKGIGEKRFESIRALVCIG